MSAIGSGRRFFGERKAAIYDVLAHLPPGLMVDVGAAGGAVTRRMLLRSPQSQVIAIEPFPGNHPHFERSVGGDARVTLIKAAASPEAGRAKLFVKSAMAGSKRGSGPLLGSYSSNGFLIAHNDKRAASGITVDTIPIDDVIGDRHVRFMKIDVQGSELGVLQSAERATRESRIDFMFIEFDGERDVLTHLLEGRMQIFDSGYLLVPRLYRGRGWKRFLLGKRPMDFSNWDVFLDLTLTNGGQAHRAWPKEISYDTARYCRFFSLERDKLGGVFTDLVAVAPHFVDQFTRAASKAAAT